MEIRLVSSQEHANKKIVSGKSTINHRIRVELRLTMEQYVIMDFVYNYNLKNTTNIKFGEYYRATGLIPEDVGELDEEYEDLGLLVWNKTDKRVDVNDEWKAIHSTNGQFDELWVLHQVGNKKMAQGKLPAVLKKIEFAELKQKLIVYLKHCDQNNVYKKHLATWLNPLNECWNDILVANPMNKQAPLPSKTQIRFKPQQ